MSEELKPCPFCGGDEIQFVRHSTHHGSMCCFEGCSARGPAAYSVKSPDGEDFSDHSEAIAAWNTRASAPEMADEQIMHMVNRFLGWKLPEDFRPDSGIVFDADADKRLNPRNIRHVPYGTNLLCSRQAEEMVRHMVAGLPVGREELISDWKCSRSDIASYDAVTGEEVAFIYPPGNEPRLRIGGGGNPAEQARAIIDAINANRAALAKARGR